MIEKRCNPLRKCEIIEEQDESEVPETKAYCYNIASKLEVCKPKTCPAKNKTDIEEIDTDRPEQLEEARFILIPLEAPREKCVPWKTASSGQEGIESAEGLTPQDSARQSDDQNVETSADATKTDIRDGKKLNSDTTQMLPDNQDGRPTNLDRDTVTASSENIQHSKEGSGPVEVASRDNTESTKEILVSVEECECCNCNPCECAPRGLIIENIIAALRNVQSSGELSKLLHLLSPEALATIDNVLIKESTKAALWAAGGAANFVGGIENENFKKALREAWMRGDFDEMSSCHCLPNMCPCPGGHRIYASKEEKDGLGRKQKQKQEQRAKKGVELLIKRKLSETCVCPATKHYLTPASSGTTSSDELTAATKRIYWRDMMICACPRLEQTLAILKPEVVQFRDIVVRAIKKYGLDIINERRVQLTPEEASELYAKYYGRTQFPNMIVSISYAPVIVFSLGGINAVANWKNIIGPNGLLPSEWFLPDWIRRKYGYMPDIPDTLHASGSLAVGERENRYFFPESIIEPVMKNSGEVKEYISKYVSPTLLKGLALSTKSRPADPIAFLAEWLLYNNPFQPRFPAYVCLAPT